MWPMLPPLAAAAAAAAAACSVGVSGVWLGPSPGVADLAGRPRPRTVGVNRLPRFATFGDVKF